MSERGDGPGRRRRQLACRRMQRARTHLPAVALGILVALPACGASQSALPAATSVVMTEPELTGPSTSESSEPITTPSSIADTIPAAGSSTVPASQAPVTAGWTNATDGLVGVPSECGNLSLVSARPDQDVLIASIAKQGLWASAEGTDSWARIGDAAGSAKIANRGSSIVYDPTDANTFWESGTYNGGGVYRTNDGGASFHQLGNLSHVDAVSVDFTDPKRNTLLATVHESNHAFRSTDGGATWFDLTSFLPTDIGRVSGPLVIDDHTFLLGTNTGTASALLRSDDAGSSWAVAYDGGVVGSPLIAKADGAIYWMLERINGILVSRDGGSTWSVIPPKTETLPNFATLLELLDGSLASISNDHVVISRDHGASWTPIEPPLPITASGITYSAFRRAFYVWHFDCDFTTDDPILPTSIMRLDFDPAAA